MSALKARSPHTAFYAAGGLRGPEDLPALEEAGVTAISLRFVHRSRAHYVEQLEAMAALIAGDGHDLQRGGGVQ